MITQLEPRAASEELGSRSQTFVEMGANQFVPVREGISTVAAPPLPSSFDSISHSLGPACYVASGTSLTDLPVTTAAQAPLPRLLG